MKRMTAIAFWLQAILCFHFLNAGIVTLSTCGIHIRINRIGHGPFAVRLAVTDKAFHQHYTVFALVPILSDFRCGFDMTFKTIRNGIGTL